MVCVLAGRLNSNKLSCVLATINVYVLFEWQKWRKKSNSFEFKYNLMHILLAHCLTSSTIIQPLYYGPQHSRFFSHRHMVESNKST